MQQSQVRADEAVKLGANMLRWAYGALSRTTRCDVSTLSRVRSGWPEVLLTSDELRDQEAEDPPRHYTARQLKVAESYCDLFVAMPRFTRQQKRAALSRAVSPTRSWRKIGSACGMGWQQARYAYDSVVVCFAYEVAKMEGVELEELRVL